MDSSEENPYAGHDVIAVHNKDDEDRLKSQISKNPYSSQAQNHAQESSTSPTEAEKTSPHSHSDRSHSSTHKDPDDEEGAIEEV